jgi:membrane fusion protein, multidrug efflux system
MITKRTLLVAITGIIISISLNSCKNTDGKDAKAGAGGRPPVAVNAFIARTENITSTVNASGTLVSNEEIEIRPELSARIVKLNFTEGASVSKGQLLVKLDDADLQAQLKKLQAQQLLTQKNVDRLAELLKINGVSKQEYDVAQTQQKAYDADIEAIRVQIQKAEIRAPFNGQIGLTNISEGAYVTPQTIITMLQQVSPLKVDFSIPEKYSQMLKNGSNLHFTVDGFKDTFTAAVYASEPKIEVDTRNIKVRARTPNTTNKLLPGMFANVSLGIQSRTNAVMVPTQALVPVARGKQIILVKGGKASFVPVETGLRNADLVEITKGVLPGDTIVITGLMQLRPNGDVKIVKIEQ